MKSRKLNSSKRKKTKKIIAEKIKAWEIAKQEQVLRSRNMKEIWDAINTYMRRKTRKGEGIKPDEWVKNFKKILGGDQEEEDKEIDEEEKQERKVTKPEDVDYILNKDISRQEIEEALKSLKN